MLSSGSSQKCSCSDTLRHCLKHRMASKEILMQGVASWFDMVWCFFCCLVCFCKINFPCYTWDHKSNFVFDATCGSRSVSPMFFFSCLHPEFPFHAQFAWLGSAGAKPPALCGSNCLKELKQATRIVQAPGSNFRMVYLWLVVGIIFHFSIYWEE